MNKIPCDIIKDLLPLYKDHVCSEKTMELVENHLPECESCREYLEAMEAELPPVTLPPCSTEQSDGHTSASLALEDIEVFQKIAQKLNWMKVTISFFAVIITIMVISLINTISGEYITKLPIFDKRVAAKDVSVTELYQLKNGDFYITLESDFPCDILSYGSISSPDGKSYMESYDNGQCRLSFEKTSIWGKFFLNHLSYKSFSFVIPYQEILDLDETDGYQSQGSSAIVHTTALICYEGKGNEQLTIWKEGQKIAAAPEMIEQRVLHQQRRQETGIDEQPEISSKYADNILVLY